MEEAPAPQNNQNDVPPRNVDDRTIVWVLGQLEQKIIAQRNQIGDAGETIRNYRVVVERMAALLEEVDRKYRRVDRANIGIIEIVRHLQEYCIHVFNEARNQRTINIELLAFCRILKGHIFQCNRELKHLTEDSKAKDDQIQKLVKELEEEKKKNANKEIKKKRRLRIGSRKLYQLKKKSNKQGRRSATYGHWRRLTKYRKLH